jgi:sugar diacid utilization regulator
MRAWFDRWGYRESPGPIRTPADKKLGILERWCIPVRFKGAQLGFIWLIFAPRKVTQQDLEPAVEVANHIGALLYRRQLLTQVDSDLLRLLLIPNPENERAAAEARAFHTYSHEGPIAVVVVGSPNGAELSPTELNDLIVAIQRASRQGSLEPALTGVIVGHGVALAALRKRDDLRPAIRLAERIHHLAAHLGDLDVLVAVGGATELEHASRSYGEARRALRVARAMPDFRPLVTWNDLGVFRTLSLVPQEEAVDGAVDARVRALLTDESLATTAEVFLNLAGDVQATAAELFVHRTTLYQRLDRITALYKLDLRRNGDHRLITHLGLKLARLASA